MSDDAQPDRNATLIARRCRYRREPAAARTRRAGSDRPVELDQAVPGRLGRSDPIARQQPAPARIDAALARAGRRSYGRCCGCGQQIGPMRLAADPGAPFCRDCADRSAGAHRIRLRRPARAWP